MSSVTDNHSSRGADPVVGGSHSAGAVLAAAAEALNTDIAEGGSSAGSVTMNTSVLSLGICALTFAPVLGVCLAFGLDWIRSRFTVGSSGGEGTTEKSKKQKPTRRWVARAHQSVQRVLSFEALATSFACAFMMISCKLMLEETLHQHEIDTAGEFGSLALWIALGMGSVYALTAWLDGGKSELLFFVMLFHTAAEGAAVGTMLQSASFATVLISLVVHNVPEGFVSGSVALQESKCFASAAALALLSHLPQPGFLVFSIVTEMLTALPLQAIFVLQGLSVGSIAGTCCFELVPTVSTIVGFRSALFLVSVSLLGLNQLV